MTFTRVLAMTGILALSLGVPPGAWAQEGDGSMEGDAGSMEAPAAEPKAEHPNAKGKKPERKPGREDGKFADRLGQQIGKMSVDEMLAKYDADADGALSAEEVATMRAARIDQLLKQHSPRLMRTFDRDGDGMLSDAEQAEMDTRLGAFREKLGGMIDQLVTRSDADKDGALSADELDRIRQFQKARETMATGEGGDAPGKGGRDLMGKRDLSGEYLAQFDADGDGGLSRQELDAVIAQRENAVVEAERELLMARFDEDKDGALNEQESANQKEYTDLMKLEARQRIEYMLERFDGDKDGALSADELAVMKDAAGGRGEAKKADKGKKRKGAAESEE